MKKEIASGVYLGKPTGAKTVAGYADTWLAARTTRAVRDDRDRYRIHVAGRARWFVDMRLEDLRVIHTIRLAKELSEPFVNAKGKTQTLAPRTHANIFKSLLGPMFRDARIHDLMVRNVMELPRGTLNGASKRRKPYEAADVIALTNDERIAPHWRVFFALLFYTGARVGEVAGLRFCDWDRDPKPLGALLIEKQYDAQPLKTARQVGEHARQVPVHPFLERALVAWQATGFELVYARKPLPTDFIVPRTSRGNRNQSAYAAYGAFRAALERLGIENRTMHATRNTFISLARRAGARADVLEKVTHNAKGTTFDVYTHFDWAPLCEAVGCFMVSGALARPLSELSGSLARGREQISQFTPLEYPLACQR
jgi:integrase